MKKIFNARYLVAYSVALFSFLVYLPALRNDFVNWDDGDYVYENPHIQSLNMKLMKWAIGGFHFGNWHPLTWTSHALDYALWGLNPAGHHLTSMIIHSINTLLVVLLVIRLTEVYRKRERHNKSPEFSGDGNANLIAGAATGLLFGIHPLHVESVAWIAERKDVLCALFFLLAVRSYLKFVSNTNNASQEKMVSRFTNNQYLYALGFFSLALLSKPMAITLPVVLLIMDWYPCGRICSVKTLRDVFIEKFPFFVLSSFSAVVTILAQSSGKAIIPLEAGSLTVRVIMSAKALVFYLSKMLVPVDLIPFYHYPKDVSLFSLKYILPVLLVAAFTLTSIVVRNRQKLWLAIWSYYLITLLPVLGIIQVGVQSMANRYTYLPSIGPFMVIGLGIALLVKKGNDLRSWARPVKLASCILGGLYVLFLSYQSIQQITIWRNSITLWNYAIEKDPGEMVPGYYNLGLAYGEKGLYDIAIGNFSKAIEINPKLDIAYNNRGVAYFQQSRYDKAFSDFSEAINLNPNNAEAYVNRGYLYLKGNNAAFAIPDLQRGCYLGNWYGCKALQDLKR